MGVVECVDRFSFRDNLGLGIHLFMVLVDNRLRIFCGLIGSRRRVDGDRRWTSTTVRWWQWRFTAAQRW